LLHPDPANWGRGTLRLDRHSYGELKHTPMHNELREVRNLDRSEDFYSGTLGMRVISRLSDPRMTFFTLETTDNHHDFALIDFGSVAPAPASDATGLAHLAFKVGSSLVEFSLARRVHAESGTPVLYEAQRGFSRSVHVLDPDGNEIELYVEISSD
jgi:catechol 2,3-dioxygenase